MSEQTSATTTTTTTKTTKHVLTSSFNRYEPTQQREETNKWPFNTIPAANAVRAYNELSRRIKWPTALNSLGIDSNESFHPIQRFAIPFHFPVVHESSTATSSSSTIRANVSLSHSNIQTHMVPATTIVATNADISDKNHNSNDSFNETANIVSNVIDIIANTTHNVPTTTSMTNVSVTVPALAQVLPNGFEPEIYIDENGIFQIKYVCRMCDMKNNGTISIEMFPTNVIGPSANNASQQHITTNNTTASINAEIDETAINSYDNLHQYELDVRFDGLNESVKNSKRGNTNTNTTTNNDSRQHITPKTIA